MSLTVLQVAFPFAPVGPDAVGGAEQVVAALDAALERAGHRSLVVAVEGSEVSGGLLPVPAVRGMIDEATRSAGHAAVRTRIEEALARHPVDLIHLHGVDFPAYLPPPGVPVLVTLHLPLDWYPVDALAPARTHTHLLGVSESQTRTAPPGARLLPPIPNGVAVDRFAMRVTKRRFAVAMGRVCPEKGFHLAFDAARLADVQCLLAGAVFPYPEHDAYYRTEIVPRLDNRRRFLGAIGFARKRWMLSAARCLLVPSLAPETGSLAAIEALACGCPVVAFPTGALPDLVEPGVTGFLVDGVEAMAEAIDAADRIDPEACRAVARARFSLDRMVERYFALYADVAAGRVDAVAGAA